MDEKGENVFLFKHRKYKISVTVGKDNVMYPLTAVLDTGARPNVIHAGHVPETWRSLVKPLPPNRNVRLYDAQNRPMSPTGSIFLSLRTDEFRARVEFLVVASLFADVILGTTFIARQVKAILPPLQKILFHHAPVALIGDTKPKRFPPASPKTAQAVPKPLPRHMESRKIQERPLLRVTASAL